MNSRVILDLHGTRAREGVDIDAFETFLGYFRAALREFSRAQRGAIARKGGRPFAQESAASAFRLVEFRTGSALATLAPSIGGDGSADDLALDDTGEALAVTTLRGLLVALEADESLPEPVVEALGSARGAIGDDGSFGVALANDHETRRAMIDEKLIERLRRPDDASEYDTTIAVTGRLHMIEVDPPNRRVAIRAQDGVDWTCTYPDHLHLLVTQLIERLVRTTGTGRRMATTTRRLRIDELQPVAAHTQDPLFTTETIPVAELEATQSIDAPQGLAALVDDEWTDDEASRRFLEATLGTVQNP